MASTRKNILKSLMMLDNQIKLQQQEIIQDKTYINQSIKKAKSALPLLMISAFIVGWKISRKRFIKPLLKQLIEIGSLAAVASFKKEIIKAFNR